MKLVIRKKWFPTLIPALLTLFTLCYFVLNLLVVLPWVHRHFPGFLTFKNGIVGAFNQFHWPAAQTALKTQDNIFSVDGQEVHKGSEIYAAATDQPLGTFITYGFSRGHETLEEVTLPVIAFTWRDFITLGFIPLFSGLLIFFMGVGLFYWRPSSSGRWPLLFLHFIIANLAIGLVDFHLHYHLAYGHLILLAFAGGTLLHFAVTFPERQAFLTGRRWLECLPYTLSLALVIPFLFYFETNPDRWAFFFDLLLAYMTLAYLAWIVCLILIERRSIFPFHQPLARALLISQGILALVPGIFGIFLMFNDIELPLNFAVAWKILFPLSIFIPIALTRLTELQSQFLRTELKASLGTLIVSLSQNLKTLSTQQDWEGLKRLSESLESFQPASEAPDQAVDFEKGIDCVLALLQPQLGARIRVQKNYGHIPIIRGCPARIYQLLFNIILNAVEAIPNEGDLAISTREGETFVEIAVKDTGHGISENYRDKIFEPFFTTKPQGGTGLGLSLAEKIIKDHRGKIVVQSELGRGSTVTIRCPL